MDREFSRNYITLLIGELGCFDHDAFNQIIGAMLDAYKNDRRIFIMGNGGSAATASHFVCDMNKGCCLNLKKKFKVVCLNDNIPSLMAIANGIHSRVEARATG